MSTTPKNVNAVTKIYVLKDPDSHQVRYVGKTVQSLIVRLGQHIYDSKSKKNHRAYWIQKLVNGGKLPLIEEIDSCSWEDSSALETFYIAKYKAEGADLINQTEGGEGTLGKIVSTETRKKQSESMRKRTPKVYQYDLSGNLVKEWENAMIAAEALGFKNASGITRCLRGDRFKYKNFIWKTELTENANKELEESIKQKHERNISKEGSYEQSLLAKIISLESKLKRWYYVYSSPEYSLNNLLYVGISANDISNYINENMNRLDIDLNSTISSYIDKGKGYYDKYYFSYKSPEGFKNNKHLSLLKIYYGNKILYGVEEASNYFKVNKLNIINNLKGKTSLLETKEFGKIKLTWKINEEHSRLYAKTYKLSADKIEEIAKKQLNIEVTPDITKGFEVL